MILFGWRGETKAALAARVKSLPMIKSGDGVDCDSRRHGSINTQLFQQFSLVSLVSIFVYAGVLDVVF